MQGNFWNFRNDLCIVSYYQMQASPGFQELTERETFRMDHTLITSYTLFTITLSWFLDLNRLL